LLRSGEIYSILSNMGFPKDVIPWRRSDFDARAAYVVTSLPATVVREGRLLCEFGPVAAWSGSRMAGPGTPRSAGGHSAPLWWSQRGSAISLPAGSRKGAKGWFPTTTSGRGRRPHPIRLAISLPRSSVRTGTRGGRAWIGDRANSRCGNPTASSASVL